MIELTVRGISESERGSPATLQTKDLFKHFFRPEKPTFCQN